MNNTLIISDIDGVILNFSKAFKEHVWKTFKVYISEDPMAWDYGIDKDEIYSYLKSFWKSDGFKNIEEYPDIYDELNGTNYHMVFATDVPEYAQENRWCNLNALELYNKVYFGADKNLVIILKLEEYDKVIFIDDKVENVINAVNLNNPKLKVLYPIRGYNYKQLKDVNAYGYSSCLELFRLLRDI